MKIIKSYKKVFSQFLAVLCFGLILPISFTLAWDGDEGGSDSNDGGVSDGASSDDGGYDTDFGGTTGSNTDCGNDGVGGGGDSSSDITSTCSGCTSWTDYSACSVPCGGGTQSRSKTCYDYVSVWSLCATISDRGGICQPGSVPTCVGTATTESRSCNTQACCVPNCDTAGTVCSGVKFADSCGTANACTGTKTCGVDYCYDADLGGSPGGYTCIDNDLYWYYDYCVKTCSAGVCGCNWLDNTCGVDSQDCGNDVCDATDPVYEYCSGDDIWVKNIGDLDQCFTTGCQTIDDDCNHALQEPCEVGYTCKPIDIFNAECVPKSSTWIEI